MMQLVTTKSLSYFLLLISLLLLTWTLSTSTALAAESTEFEGWAWSGYTNPVTGGLEGVGWISMSCENTDTCATSDYRVKLDASDHLTGYAWSENIGWIKFDNLGTTPSTDGNPSGPARVQTVGGVSELAGWARACAGAADVIACTGGANPDAGGWDGWISLKGIATDGNPYGIHLDSTGTGVDPAHFYAWGGNINVGWIDFSGVILTEAAAINSFTATPDEIGVGNPVTLTWDIQGFDSCSASNDRGQTDWNSNVASSTGVHSTNVYPPLGDTNYTLTCLDGTTPFTETVLVKGIADIAINNFSISGTPTANPDSTYDNVHFGYDVQGIPDGATAPYTLRVTGSSNDTLTGTTSQSGSVTTFNPPLVLNNLNFGDQDFRLEIDLPAPGDITPEIDEVGNNSYDLPQQGDLFPALEPIMSINSDKNLLRYNEKTQISWSVLSPHYEISCSVKGAGLDIGPLTNTADPSVEIKGQADTAPLHSTSVITLKCSPLASSDVFSKEVRVELVPNVEEI